MDFFVFVSLGIICASLNLLAFILFAYDKLKARIHGWRISETSLLLLAAIGPCGALIAMVVFRHKTRHVKFVLVPFFVVLHLLLGIWFWPDIKG